MRNAAFTLSLFAIFMIPWENVIQFGESDTTGARLIGILAATFWLFSVIIRGKLRKPHVFHVAVYLFVLWNLLSVLWSVGPDRTLGRLLTYFQLAGLAYIIWDLYTTREAVRAGLQAYVLGAYVAIGSTIHNYLSGIEPEFYYLRYGATGFNVNDLAYTLALGIPVAWYLATMSSDGTKVRQLQLVNYAYLPLAVLAILLTASRGGLIATSLAFLFVLGSLTRLKPISRALLLVTLVGAMFALMPLIPQRSLARFATIGASIAEADLSGRVAIWRQGATVFLEHPLLGVGSGTFRTVVESGKVAHSAFLNILVEAGMIGFGVFAVVVGIVAIQAIRQPKWDSRFWLSILLVLALAAAVSGWEIAKPTWLFMSLLVASASVTSIGNELPVRANSLVGTIPNRSPLFSETNQ